MKTRKKLRLPALLLAFIFAAGIFAVNPVVSAAAETPTVTLSGTLGSNMMITATPSGFSGSGDYTYTWYRPAKEQVGSIKSAEDLEKLSPLPPPSSGTDTNTKLASLSCVGRYMAVVVQRGGEKAYAITESVIDEESTNQWKPKFTFTHNASGSYSVQFSIPSDERWYILYYGKSSLADAKTGQYADMTDLEFIRTMSGAGNLEFRSGEPFEWRYKNQNVAPGTTYYFFVAPPKGQAKAGGVVYDDYEYIWKASVTVPGGGTGGGGTGGDDDDDDDDDSGETPAEEEAEYEFWAESGVNGQIYAQFGMNNAMTLWIGGGRDTQPNGAYKDNKVKQVNLYVVEDGAHYNITAAKGIVWGLGTADAPKYTDETKKNKLVTKNNTISVAKGKLTAGKSLEGTAGEGATQYVWACSTNADKDKSLKPLARFKVNMKIASMLNELNEAQGYEIGGKADNAAVKKTSTFVSVNETKQIFIANAATKTGSGDAATYTLPSVENTWTVSVAKTKISGSGANTVSDYVAKLVDPESGNLVEQLTVTINSSNLQSPIVNPAFTIKGLKLLPGGDNAPDKISKATVTVTNNQSGKSVKLTVNVGNSVKQTNDSKILTLTSDAVSKVEADYNLVTGAVTKVGTAGTVSASSDGVIVPFDYNKDAKLTITSKPVVGIFTETAFNSLKTENKFDYTKFVDKGKPKLPAVSDKFPLGYAAKIQGKFNDTVRVSIPKNAAAGTYYVVAAYGVKATEIGYFKVVVGGAPGDDD